MKTSPDLDVLFSETAGGSLLTKMYDKRDDIDVVSLTSLIFVVIYQSQKSLVFIFRYL